MEVTEISREQYVSLQSDVESLVNKPLPEAREAIASKVATYFTKGSFSKEENTIAFEIIQLLAKDVEVRVRKALAENIKTSKDLPREIALRLASDVEEVSEPILEFSEVLTEGDLVAIVQSAVQVGKLIAISRRNNLPDTISKELINTKNDDVVVSLFSNNTANISQGSLEFTIEQFKYSGQVVGALLDRGDLPIGIVEKVVNAVSTEIREELVNKHNLKKHIAEEISKVGQERVTLGLLDEAPELKIEKKYPEKSVTRTERLVDHLFKSERLSESLIFRALCEGNLLFFEVSMARRAGIPIINARTLLHDGNTEALKSLWTRAKMPDSFFEPVCIIIKFAVSPLNQGTNKNNYRQRLLGYLHEHGFDNSPSLMSYFAAIITNSLLIDDIV